MSCFKTAALPKTTTTQISKAIVAKLPAASSDPADINSPTGDWDDGRPEGSDLDAGVKGPELNIVNVSSTSTESASGADSDPETSQAPSDDTQISAQPTVPTGQSAPVATRWGGVTLPSISLPTLTDEQKATLKKAAIGSVITAVILGIGGGVYAGLSAGRSLPDRQAYENMRDFLQECLDKAGIHNIFGGELADHVLGQLQAAHYTMVVNNAYAKPGWENTVECPDPSTYRGSQDYKFVAGIFVDAVNDVLQRLAATGNALQPSQAMLFVSLLLGVASNFL